jgi:hypothetical protein
VETVLMNESNCWTDSKSVYIWVKHLSAFKWFKQVLQKHALQSDRNWFDF